MIHAVVNKRTHPPSSRDVYIGRPSKWGNPFVVGRDGTRKECVAKYRAWLPTQKHLMAALHELNDKTLVCFCKPLECHGDVLAEFVCEDVMVDANGVPL